MTRPFLNDEIRAEADRILDSGLRLLLAEGGEVHIVGSYALGLMTGGTWTFTSFVRIPTWKTFFHLGGRIAALLHPHRMHFRDESKVRTPDLPPGFYWGVYLGDERQGAWKIDIWQTNRDGFDAVRRFGERIAGQLDAASRQAIVAIKGVPYSRTRIMPAR